MGLVVAEVTAAMTEDMAETVVVIEATGVTAEMAQVRYITFIFFYKCIMGRFSVLL